MEQRPGGSIGAALDVLGDRWTLLVLRSVIFDDRRYFRALLIGVDGIASNILADRLVRLVDAGLLTRGTAARGQRARYSLSEAGIQTVPVLYALGNWGLDWRPNSRGIRDVQQDLRDHAPTSVELLMADLRERHDVTPRTQ